MANIGFFWRDDYVRKYAQLTIFEFGLVILACTKYHATGEVPALEGKASLVFDAIRDDIDASTRSYEAKCETNRRNRMSAIAYKNEQSHPANGGSGQSLPVMFENRRMEPVVDAAAQSRATNDSSGQPLTVAFENKRPQPVSGSAAQSAAAAEGDQLSSMEKVEQQLLLSGRAIDSAVCSIANNRIRICSIHNHFRPDFCDIVSDNLKWHNDLLCGVIQ